jgi:hypothetical protein
MSMAGYSGTPLPRKLGLKPGAAARVIGAPIDYRELLGVVPDGVTFDGERDLDFVHVFVTERHDLTNQLLRLQDEIKPNGMIWVSWPKKSSKVPTDITEDTIREVALPMGLVDTKVAAVTDVWSGLRLVIRKENRKERGK